MEGDCSTAFIRFENLSRTYRQGERQQRVLDGICGEIQRGESVALLGRSGCGKSTLLNLIGGIDQPDGGDIFIDGSCINRMDEHGRTLFRRRHIGFIYQFFNLIPTLTVIENLLLPLELNGWDLAEGRRRSMALLEQVGLSEREASYPDQLSGGEQQRVAVARALVHRPAVVLADEPTGNLDAESGQQVLELLDRLVRDELCTLVMVTHSQVVAARADRVFHLKQGCFVSSEDVVW